MCTRAALPRDAESIKQSLVAQNNIEIHQWEDSGEFEPKFNIGDMMRLPVIFSQSERKAPLKEGQLLCMRSSRWRLIPDYCTVEDESKKTLQVSAEELVNGQGFGKIARTQKRCAVVCQGYFSFPKAQKELPTYIKRADDHLVLLAGICAASTIDDKEIHSFAVVTAKGQLGQRRPVILAKDTDVQTWLTQPRWTTSLNNIITAPHADAVMPLRSYKVSERVRKPDVESSSLIDPVNNRKDGLKQAFEVAKAKNKHPRDGSDDDERQTPPPYALTSRVHPLTPSSSKKRRLTSPVPSPCKVPITPSKPVTVTQVNAPSPEEVSSGTSSAGSPSHNSDSDAEMSVVGPDYVAGSSENEDGEDQSPGTASVGTVGKTTSRKGKERERKGRARGNAKGQSKYFPK